MILDGAKLMMPLILASRRWLAARWARSGGVAMIPISRPISGACSLRWVGQTISIPSNSSPLVGITVKSCTDMKTAPLEIVVAQECVSHIADTYERAFPNTIDAKGFLDGSDQFLNVITDTPNAKLAKICKILTYLRRIDRAGPSKLFGGDDIVAVA